MLDTLTAGAGIGETILEWIEYIAVFIEHLAVVVILVGVLYSLLRFVARNAFHTTGREQYRQLRIRLGRILKLGLEILVAATIVHTVAVDTTPRSVAVLGMMVIVRTILSLTLAFEIEGRWPWQLGSGQN